MNTKLKAIYKKYTHCLNCKEEFNDKRRNQSHGICQKCYSPKYGMRLPKLEDYWDELKRDYCIDCKSTFGGTTKKASRGRCRYCYNKFLIKHGFTHCSTCGDKLLHPQTISICKLCRKGMKSEKKSEQELDDVIKRISGDGISISRNDKNTLKPMLRDIQFLLLRFKWGTYGLADHYNIAHIYLKIWDYDQSLDVFPPEKQLQFMLKRLKGIYLELVK